MNKKLIISICVIVLILIGLGIGIFIKTNKKDVEIRTDVKPIYNHFPTLPKTDTIKWTSKTSSGIGLTTIKMSIFAKYEDTTEIDNLLNENTYTEYNKNKYDNMLFIPDIAKDVNKWYVLNNMSYAFQDGINETKKFNTTVLVSEDHKILYVFAIGE